MFYIHQTTCISPQHTFPNANLETLVESAENKLSVLEPAYTGVAPTMLRRMGKAVRIGVGAALPMLQSVPMPAGIIIGTANGGMGESVKFLQQIVDYHEDTLTPGNFVQSTANALASQISLLTSNKGYNITHVHRGLAFENAMVDAAMVCHENPQNTYLLVGVDEISTYNYHIDYLNGLYKHENISNKDLYAVNTAGSIAGEGAAMFLVNSNPEAALAKVQAVAAIHHNDERHITERLQNFLQTHLPAGEQVDLLLSGENGDSRFTHFYNACEQALPNNIAVARFKHMCGDYPTAAAFALWLACTIKNTAMLPQHMAKTTSAKKAFKNVLIYNHYQGVQHSFMLVCR